MSLYNLKNEWLSVVISSVGAELQSVYGIEEKKEYLYNGDPNFWNRRSPILFPFVGAVTDDIYRVDGVEYKMGQHGFARDENFSLVSYTENSIELNLESSQKTLEIYPYSFSLTVKYTIDKKTVKVEWEVKNCDDRDMYYDIGGHPGFFVPENCSILLDKMPVTMSKVTDRYIEDGVNIIDSICFEGLYIPVKDRIFKNDALVFEDYQISEVSLCKEREAFVRVKLSSPVVGIWAPDKENCPFICIEPWYGRCDALGFRGDLSEKKWTNKLVAGEIDKYLYTIEII